MVFFVWVFASSDGEPSPAECATRKGSASRPFTTSVQLGYAARVLPFSKRIGTVERGGCQADITVCATERSKTGLPCTRSSYTALGYWNTVNTHYYDSYTRVACALALQLSAWLHAILLTRPPTGSCAPNRRMSSLRGCVSRITTDSCCLIAHICMGARDRERLPPVCLQRLCASSVVRGGCRDTRLTANRHSTTASLVGP
jgi:hypothetical protein